RDRIILTKIQSLAGSPLSEDDLQRLEDGGIARDLAEQTLLRRVTNAEGADIIGRATIGAYAGLIFPYILPGEPYVREYRLRRDKPELEIDADGKLKEKNKYLAPPGRGNLLYFVPGTPPEWLEDTSIPVAITEGEKKTIALYGLAWHRLDRETD